jgi:AraC-like DNA-binding protein
MEDILKIRDLEEGPRAYPDYKTAFTFYDTQAGEKLSNSKLTLNYIFFVITGEISVSCNAFQNHIFRANDMAFMQKSSSIKIDVKKSAKLCVFYFDTLLSSMDQQLFKTFLPDAEKTVYQFRPIHIPFPIRLFLEQVRFIQQKKIDCNIFNALKHREFFLLIHYLCPREDIVEFFFDLICKSLNFRNKVLDKYMNMKGNRVEELAALVGMGRKNFEKRFRTEFDTSPAKWIQQETAKRVRLFLEVPGITISDAMDKFHFNSPSHFNRFCQQYLSASPGAIIKAAKQLKIES